MTIGHQAMLHGCTVGDGALIGIQAVVMNGAVIGEELPGRRRRASSPRARRFPTRSLILGAPAKVVRELTEEEAARLAADRQLAMPARGETFRTEFERVADPHLDVRDGALRWPICSTTRWA